MKRLWRKLTFGNSGSSPAERVVNVLAVILTAPIWIPLRIVDAVRKREES